MPADTALDTFDLLDQAVRDRGPAAGFQWLIDRFREQKNYPLLFEARLMKKRHDLGLPLVLTDPATDWPPEIRRAYDEGCVEAAREVGGLFLADGDIARAWPYFRAIGETGPVAAAIDQVEPKEGVEPAIEIAFQEGVNPQRGFELILAYHGICRAISLFPHYPVRQGRDECLSLLVRTLHQELVASLKRALVQAEDGAPDTSHIPTLIEGRDWMFEGTNYYVDTSHVVSVLQISLESADPATLAAALEMAEYGKHLSPMFHYRGEPPFENVYDDHAMYLKAVLGQDVDIAVAHFRAKAAAADPEQAGTGAAQVLVGLLARLKRFGEAIEASLEFLKDVRAQQMACPSVPQLCQMEGDAARMKQLARDRGDLLSYAAGAMAEV